MGHYDFFSFPIFCRNFFGTLWKTPVQDDIACQIKKVYNNGEKVNDNLKLLAVICKEYFPSSLKTEKTAWVLNSQFLKILRTELLTLLLTEAESV